MFDVRLGPCNQDWFIYKDGVLWSRAAYRSEFQAIAALGRTEPDAADVLAARAALVDGPTIPWEQVKAELGL